jgi:hypothetical protein
MSNNLYQNHRFPPEMVVHDLRYLFFLLAKAPAVSTNNEDHAPKW